MKHLLRLAVLALALELLSAIAQDSKAKKDKSKGVQGDAKAAAANPIPRATPAAATAPEKLKVPKDFKVELLYSIPKETEGSWVAMCADDKGRLIVSDQYGPLYRVTPPPLGQTAPVKVEKINVDMGAAQGLLYAFNSLYVVVNDNKHGGRGLYRLRDTDGDDQFDKIELLRKFEESGGEHGPHAVLLAPDGKSLRVVCGNQTKLPDYALTRVPPFWGEDELTPRLMGRGFMRGTVAPRGWIAKTDPDGKSWEILTTGLRNEYDAAFNRQGELFTYDADMEWDFNTPWYRPTRVCHVVSGSEWGWRTGSAKYMPWHADNLPPVVDIGPGSPTGVTFGYGAKFPAKYQEAFFICDWSYGKLYAVHLKPSGSTYSATVEEFITGQPFPLTDLLINPKDQAMYVTVGGRKVQGGLYRVTYMGKESTAPSKPDNTGSEARAVRHQLEAFHGVKDAKAVDAAWPHLGHADRFIRTAARTALEHQDAKLWTEKALAEKPSEAGLSALLALVRVGDKSLQPRIAEALGRYNWAQLTDAQRIDWLRLHTRLFTRMGEGSADFRQQMTARLDALFPAKHVHQNAMLCEMLCWLQSPSATAKSIALLNGAPTQEEQISYAMYLRVNKAGWTPTLRDTYFKWLYHKATAMRGGANFTMFMDDIRKDALAAVPEPDQAAVAAIIKSAPAKRSPLELMAEAFAGRSMVKEWKVADLAPLVEKGLTKRSFENGRKMFGASACFACHRFGNEGGAMGPDLTSAAGKFSARDLLESVIEPSKEVSDQYAPVVFKLNDGTTVTGRIVNLSGDVYRVNSNMFDPDDLVNVDARKVLTIEPSKVSQMPEGLLNMLKQDEVLDLLAYLLSGGDAKHAMFAK